MAKLKLPKHNKNVKSKENFNKARGLHSTSTDLNKVSICVRH